MQNEIGLNKSRFLALVRDDTTHKVRSGRVQHSHQLVQLFLVTVAHSLETTSFAFLSASLSACLSTSFSARYNMYREYGQAFTSIKS